VLGLQTGTVMTNIEEQETMTDSQDFVASDVTNDFRVRAAFVRTAMSSEQSLLSWIRTSISLYTFGFSITQFFYYLASKKEAAELSASPRLLGLALVATGILAIVLGTFEHMARIKTLREAGLPENVQFFLPLGSAAVFLFIGIVALVAITMNWHF
jgi:putative membrane protein